MNVQKPSDRLRTARMSGVRSVTGLFQRSPWGRGTIRRRRSSCANAFAITRKRRGGHRSRTTCMGAEPLWHPLLRRCGSGHGCRHHEGRRAGDAGGEVVPGIHRRVLRSRRPCGHDTWGAVRRGRKATPRSRRAPGTRHAGRPSRAEWPSCSPSAGPRKEFPPGGSGKATSETPPAGARSAEYHPSSWPCGQQSRLKKRQYADATSATRHRTIEANGIDCGGQLLVERARREGGPAWGRWAPRARSGESHPRR